MGTSLTLCNMLLVNRKKLIRYEKEEQLVALWWLFGPARGFSTNDSKQRVGKSLLHHARSTINFLSGSNHAIEFKLRAFNKGTDNACNIDNNKLVIKIRSQQHVIPQEGIKNAWIVMLYWNIFY